MKILKIIIFLLGTYLIIKAGSLFWIYLNWLDGYGDGIGIYLLCFEINDKVPIRYVPEYAAAIITLGIILILPMITIYKSIKKGC